MSNPIGELLRFPIVQTIGTEPKKVISQKVVTEELNKRVPATRKINGKTLANDVALTAADLSVYTKAEIDGLMTVNKDQTDRLEINNRWLVTAPSRGIIPASPGEGRVGTTTNRFAEAWVNIYRGSEIILSGNANIGGKLRTGGTIYQKTDGRSWAMGMVTSSSEYKGVVGVTKDDGQTFSDYIRIGPNRELVHHVTINDNPEEYDIYTKYNKPAPMDIGVYSKAEIDSKLADVAAAVPFTLITESSLVSKGSRLIVVMSDGVSKTLSVNKGLPDLTSVLVNATDWNQSLGGLKLSVDFGDEFWTTGLKDYSIFEFTKPGIIEFTKFQGKWRVTAASGEAAMMKTAPPPWIKVKDNDPSGIHFTGPFKEVADVGGSTIRYRWVDENTLHFVGIARCDGVVPTGTNFITFPSEIGERVQYTDWSPATRANDNGLAYVEVTTDGLRVRSLVGATNTSNIMAWIMINVTVILEEV